MAGEVLSGPFLHKRGTSSRIATYAGPQGELVVDLTNNTVVVQTGSAGGVALAKATTTVTGSNGVSVTGGNLGTNIGIALATVSGLTTGTYGPQANATPAAGGTFTVPSLTVDSFGRVTSAANRTVTIPSSTHNTAYLYVGTSSGTGNASTSNGSTYLILKDGSTYTRKKIIGSGSVAVSSDSSGNITISGTSTDTGTDNRTNIIYMSPSGNDANDGSTAAKAIKTSTRLAELLTNITTTGNYAIDGRDTLTRQSNCIYVIMAGGTYSSGSSFYINRIPALIHFIPNGNVTITITDSFDIIDSYVIFGASSSKYYPNRNSTTAFTYSGSFSISNLYVSYNANVRLYCNFTCINATIQSSNFSIEAETFTCNNTFEVKDKSHVSFNGTSHTIGYFYLHDNSAFNSEGTGSLTINSKLNISMYSKARFNNTGGFTINAQDKTNVIAINNAIEIYNHSYAYFQQPFSITLTKNISSSGSILHIIDSSVMYAPVLLTVNYGGSGKVKYFMYIDGYSALTLNYINNNTVDGSVVARKGYVGERSEYFGCYFYKTFVTRLTSNQGIPGDISGTTDKRGEFTSNVYPVPTQYYTCGKPGYLWSTIYAQNTTISTSDKRLKTNVADIPDELLDIWEDIKLRIFKWTDSETPRLHAGIIAQDTEDLFKEHGLDIRDYSFFCYDKWDDEYEEVPVSSSEDPEENIVETRKVRSAGDSYAIRYEEFLVIEAAYQRRRADRLQAQLDLLAERVIAIEKKLP